MKADLWIKNGRLLDPGKNLCETGDLVIVNGRIAPRGVIPEKAVETVDATGCMVVPGLIDTHVHVFNSGGELGTSADLTLPPMGVTTAIDFGSAGYANFESYMRSCAERSCAEIYSLVNVSATGPISLKTSENVDPKGFNEAALKKLFDKYQGKISGLKIRMGRETIGDLGIEPLRATIRIAEQLDCRVAVHVSNSTVPVRAMAELLRTGDVFCHVYQDRGDSILNERGYVCDEIWEARRRGVLFDVAHGLRNASNEIARSAIEQGFLPDFIGTDLSSITAYRKGVIGQPYLMSKFMAFGLALEQVVAMCTAAPAAWLGMSEEIGTLTHGARGDVTVLRMVCRDTVFRDYHGNGLPGSTLLIPELTVSGGRVVYRQVGFDS